MPKCPTHNKEMRSGKFGYFCPTKIGDGPKDWCKEKADGSGEKPASGNDRVIELLETILAEVQNLKGAGMPKVAAMGSGLTGRVAKDDEIKTEDIPF